MRITIEIEEQKLDAVPASDLLIATVVVDRGLELLACDHHFTLLREHVLPELQLK